MIIFSKHAQQRFEELDRLGFHIDSQVIVDAVSEPDRLIETRTGLLIAQKALDAQHLVRVVYGLSIDNDIIITTFYIAARKRYEK